ncbi:MAG: GGDEF and EAL domain-containing protein [Hyphomicrobium sp.]|nr:GGDEF and EAL domain-containing protein [Hyphomicrobium sp.]
MAYSHSMRKAGETGGEPPSGSGAAEIDDLTVSESFDLVGVLSTEAETAYTWDIATDRIDWESNAANVLGVPTPAEIATGALYNLLIAPEHAKLRESAIRAGAGEQSANGIPFRTQYRIQHSARRPDVQLWIEDHGRWWPDATGAPKHVRGVLRIVSDRYLEEQRLLYRNDHDELTGQLSRSRLTDALTAVISRTTRSKAPAAFMMVSINNLAVTNETFGFHAGDETIRAIARAIKDKLRSGDSVGRYSATKFGIILNDCGAGALRIAAERFMRAVRDLKIDVGNAQLSATISIGGVVIPEQAGNVHQAVGCALQALDRAKLRRTDSFVAYEASLGRESQRLRSLTVADDVMSALNADRMRLVLQPMVATATGKPAIYECLLRMEMPDGRVVSAGEFIPIAEQLGLARLIDRRTLELSIRLLKRHPEIVLSINVSSLTATDPDWLETLISSTAKEPGMTRRMIVEITETTAIHDLDQTKAFVDTLRELGCRIAIDDFGAGYTSFKNLKALKVDMVKIDGAFVKDLAADQSDQIFIKTMVDLARSFDLETVAEWVGDEESVRILTDAGIDYLQGYYYGVPIDPAVLDRQS